MKRKTAKQLQTEAIRALRNASKASRASLYQSVRWPGPRGDEPRMEDFGGPTPWWETDGCDYNAYDAERSTFLATPAGRSFCEADKRHQERRAEFSYGLRSCPKTEREEILQSCRA